MAKVIDGRKNNGKHLAALSAKGGDLVRGGKVPQKLTKQAWQRMNDELGFDPLAEAVKIAKGEALTQDHPLLPYLLDTLSNWMKKGSTGEVIPTEEIESFMAKCEASLTDSWVSPELRSRHVLELLQYVYPKRKAVDLNHGGNINMDLSLKPLAPEEVDTFHAKFSDEY